MNKPERHFRRHLLRAASITALMSGAGTLAGLVQDGLVLFYFGAGVQTDALLAALALPVLLNGVVSIQAPKLLIPTFAAIFERDDLEDAWRLLSTILSFCGLVFGAVTLCGVVGSGIVLPLQIPGAAPDVVALGVSLSRILFLLVWSQGLASVLQSILYARHHYALSSATKLVTHVVTIAVIVSSGSRAGIVVVAWGMVLGTVVQLLVVASALRAQGFSYRWRLFSDDPRLRTLLRDFGYPLASHVLGETGVLVQNVIGSFLGSGSLTLLRYGTRVVQAIAGILLGSVVQVTLPMLAKHAASRDLELQRKTYLESIQILCFIGVPIAVWLWLMAEPAILLVFQRGAFSATDAAMTAAIVRLLIPNLLITRVVGATQALFFANGDFKTPFTSTVVFTLVNLLLAISLAAVAAELGVAAAASVASLVTAVYMMWQLDRRFGPIGWQRLAPFAWRLIAVATLAGLGLTLAVLWLTFEVASQTVTRILALAVPTTIGAALFALGVMAFGLLSPRIAVSEVTAESPAA